MNNINVTITLSEDDRKLLECLMASVSTLTAVIGNAQPAEVQKQVIKEVLTPAVTPTAEIPAADPVEETPAPVAETTPEVKPVSLAEFQKAVTLAVSKGAEAKAKVKAIVNKYATSVSAVPEDKRAEVLAELANI